MPVVRMVTRGRQGTHGSSTTFLHVSLFTCYRGASLQGMNDAHDGVNVGWARREGQKTPPAKTEWPETRAQVVTGSECHHALVAM